MTEARSVASGDTAAAEVGAGVSEERGRSLRSRAGGREAARAGSLAGRRGAALGELLGAGAADFALGRSGCHSKQRQVFSTLSIAAGKSGLVTAPFDFLTAMCEGRSGGVSGWDREARALGATVTLGRGVSARLDRGVTLRTTAVTGSETECCLEPLGRVAARSVLS
jgi:hypothetical protein